MESWLVTLIFSLVTTAPDGIFWVVGGELHHLSLFLLANLNSRAERLIGNHINILATQTYQSHVVLCLPVAPACKTPKDPVLPSP
jgi:hypothetical protein